MQLLERTETKDYRAIAAALSQELATTAVERDRAGGLPTYEVNRLRETGLLTLVVPQEYGGAGENLLVAMKVVQELAKADGSIGQLYGNHLGLVTLGQVLGSAAQTERDYRGTAEHQWFWGNALNTRDPRLKITPDGHGWRLNGVKGFGTGIPVADRWVFSAVQDGVEVPHFLVLPKGREGVTLNSDWDNIGQRRTASGSISFNHVWVEADEIYGPVVQPDSAFATFAGIVAQLAKTYVYLGITEGAFAAAQTYTQTLSKPWITSGVDRATADPYILLHYGELWSELQAAIHLADHSLGLVQAAWDKEWSLTHAERAAVAIAVFSAKAIATRVGTDITSRVFELTGSRSTATQYGFDRYWRDLRTFTLHDPVDYKLKDIGNWLLNQEFPLATQYS